MGGYSSGRYGGGPTVESGLTLDINELFRKRLLGDYRAGALVWTSVATGEKVASIGFQACLLDPDAAWVRLHYSANGRAEDYRVRLSRSPCHYGGHRWWWICPRSSRRVAKLYLPPGTTVFAARQAYRLAYRSQRETALDRSHNRQSRLYRRLGTEYKYFEQAPPRRPKGMHRSTYERLTAEVYGAMEVHNEVFEIGAASILARLKKVDARRLRKR